MKSAFSDIRYEYEDGKDNYVGPGKDKEETPEKVSFVAFKQHFFSTILLTDKPFEKSKLYSNELVLDEKVDTVLHQTIQSQFAISV